MSDADEALVDALLLMSRPLVGIVIRSVQGAPVDVTIPQHRVLVLLDDNGPLGVGAIATELGVNPSNATRLCDRLERLGLIARSRSDEDRRAVLVDLTAAGRRLVQAVTDVRRADLARVVAQLDGAAAPELVGALEAVGAAAHRVEVAYLRGEPATPVTDPGRVRSASS